MTEEIILQYRKGTRGSKAAAECKMRSVCHFFLPFIRTPIILTLSILTRKKGIKLEKLPLQSFVALKKKKINMSLEDFFLIFYFKNLSHMGTRLRG